MKLHLEFATQLPTQILGAKVFGHEEGLVANLIEGY